MIYDGARDAFYSSQPYPSWVFDEDTCNWDAPVERPDILPDGKPLYWDEPTTSWKEIV